MTKTMTCASEVKNLTSITWSHATNSQDLLREVLDCNCRFETFDIF